MEPGDGPLLVAWANADQRSLTLEAPPGKATLMDLMGNRTVITAQNSVVDLKLTTSPVYVFGGKVLVVRARPDR